MKMPVKQIGLALAATVLLGSVAVWATRSETGSAVPPVTYTLLDGQKQSLDQLKGKVVLVNFWATSCTTCMREMPKIIETHQKFKDRGFTTLAVAMSYDPPAYVMNYAESRKLPFPVTIDHQGEMAKTFGQVQLTPTTFLLNQKGEIVKRYIGEPDFAALQNLVDSMLKQG